MQMALRSPRRHTGWVCVVALVLAATAWAQEDDIVEFHFQPVDGEIWIKELHDVQVRDMGEMAPYQETETRSKVEIRYEALPDGGWVVHQTPLEASMKLNGEEVQNPGLAQTIGHEVLIYLTDQGDAVRVEGFKEFIRKLERSLPPATFAQVSRSMTEENLIASELREWDFLLEFMGRAVSEKEQWRVIDEVFIAGGGLIGTDGFYRFDGWTEIDGMEGFKVTFEWDSSGERMASIGEDHTLSISRRSTDEVMPRTNVDLRGSLIRVIDPDSGRLLYEVYDQSYELPLQTGGSKAHLEQRHTYRFRKVG